MTASRSVAMVTLATRTPGGQQVYEEEIARRVQARFPEGAVRRVQVRSLRSSTPGTSRLPFGLAAAAPLFMQKAMGTAAYGRADLIHRCDLRLPPTYRHEIVTIHDTAWVRFPDEGRPLRHSAAGARAASLVVTPSRFAAKEVVAALAIDQARIRVIPNGVDEAFRNAPPLSSAELDALGLPQRFILHSGGCSERKNLRLLAAAWAILAEELHDLGLVLCGPSDSRRNALFGSLPRTQIPGTVPRELHARLTATALCAVIPSTYEGFGLPLIEAMASGTAAVGVTGSSLDEVGADAALLVTPDREEFAAAIYRLVTDTELRENFQTRGRTRAAEFSWARAAEMHADVYREALER